MLDRKAFQVCKSIDEKDTVYVAIAIEFGMMLITNDKTLHTGLRSKNFKKVVLLEEMIDQLHKIQGPLYKAN